MGIVPEFLGGTPDVHYANVVFGGEIAIDAYQFPDGEIRYAKTGSAKLIGLASNYLSRITVSTPNAWKVLQGKGFTGYIRQGKVARKGKSGASKIETISGSDLDAFVRFAAEHLKKPQAIALLGASFSEVRYDRERSAFDLAPKTTPEKQRDFVLEVDRVLISNARASLDSMSMDDNYNAPHASNWQGDNLDNDSPVHESPWD